ncbi:efflux RND transporter periplasmic adaptor subunit [Simplicispira psychrophila]|uniref:efflux RND transporter periplasmic adaptor subunit n=1 Tax=Simplicispira psychrophila TaxID=80882 RepID=UPI00048096C1|nr:efflux RND transporter periplasmic adaptor subunit [Simplicispira psychrophila]
MTTTRRYALWLLGAVLLLAGLLVAGVAWWRGPQVEVIEMRRAPLVRTLQFSARVATLSRVDIGSTVTGRVDQVRVREGDVVQAGDVLVQLEDAELRAALAQAEAAAQQAAAALAGRRGSGRTAVQATLAQTEATQRAASAALLRAQQLVAQGFYSAAQLDDARRAAAVADAQALSARAQVQASQEAGTDVAQAQAQLEVARAAVGAARARLAQAHLRAPLDARVLVRAVEPGQIVQPGKALLSLALAGPTQLVAQVDERFLDQLRPDQNAAVVADAFPDRRFAARVLSLAPAVDAQRGAIEVKFALTGAPPAFLREDMTLSVEVQTGRRDAALVLPQSALRALAAGSVPTAQDVRDVLVVQGSRAELRSVRLGLHTLGAVEVLDGLAEGDQVLQRSAGKEGALRPGQRVRARPVAWTPAAGANAGNGARAEDAGSAMSNAMGR